MVTTVLIISYDVIMVTVVIVTVMIMFVVSSTSTVVLQRRLLPRETKLLPCVRSQRAPLGVGVLAVIMRVAVVKPAVKEEASPPSGMRGRRNSGNTSAAGNGDGEGTVWVMGAVGVAMAAVRCVVVIGVLLMVR